jgi:hypothetical protein
MSNANASTRHLPPLRWKRACASATGIATITTTTGTTRQVRPVVFV